MTDEQRNRVLWWRMAFDDAAERLDLTRQLEEGDTRSGIIREALRESAVLAVMRVFGKMGDKGPRMAANDDAVFDDWRDRLLAGIAARLKVPRSEVDDLLERVRQSRNTMIAHASGKPIEGLQVMSWSARTHRARAAVWSAPLHLDKRALDQLLSFCLHGADMLDDWLGEGEPSTNL